MNREAEATVLHCVDAYLPITENWIARLIERQTRLDRMVAATQFLENNLYLDDVEYLRPPIQYIDTTHAGPWFAARAWNRAVRSLLTRYPGMLARALKNRPVDLVHSHMANVGWLFRQVAERLSAKHVVSFYGRDYEHLPFIDPGWLKRYASLFETADLFLCEGSHGAGLLRRMGCPADKIRISRLGVDTSAIPFFTRDKASGSLRLLQVASFREKKGHVYSIRALAAVARDCPDATLTLIGGGSDDAKRALAAEAESLGVADRVRFAPPVPFERLHGLMSEFDVFLHPSCYAADRDCEGGAPVVFLDAQATGMPVISTKHCDIPDEVADGVTGLLCDEKDVSGLAGAIRRFYTMSSDEYAVWARAARDHVVDLYDIEETSDALRRHYREVLA